MKKSILIEDYSQYQWEEQKTNIKYQDIINYERAGMRGEHHCVMCGLIKGKQCEIPNQNKDVCKKCDCSYWRILDGNFIVKFCKGCKKFSLLSEFADKPEASKCAKCRERGRQNYYSRKQTNAEQISKKSNVKEPIRRIDSHEAFNVANNGTVSFPYPMSVPYLVLPSILPGNSNSDIQNNYHNASSQDGSVVHRKSLQGLVQRDSSPDQGMYTSHQSYSSSSHDSHSVDYHDQRPVKKRGSRPRISDSDSSAGVVDHIHHSRPQSRSSFPKSRSSSSSTLSQQFDPSFKYGRSSSSSSSSFFSPPPLEVELDHSIVAGSETDGLYPSTTSGDSGSEVVSSSLSTIDSHNTSIGSVDLNYMMSTSIANTPSETYYTTLHDTSFSSISGLDAIPTPQPQKFSQSSRHSASTPNSMVTRNMSKLARNQRAPPSIDINSLMGTPFAFPSPTSGYDSNMNHIMSPLAFGSPDGDGQMPLISPSANSSGNYQWDPRSTPLQNLASVSETLRESNSSGEKSVTGIAESNQRMTRSRSSPQVISPTQKPPKGPQRKSPRASTHLPTETLSGISPVRMNSPKYLPSPEDDSQATKRIRLDENPHLRVKVFHPTEPLVAPVIDLQDEGNISTLSNVSNTTMESHDEYNQHTGQRKHAEKSSISTKQANMNRRKRRRNDSSEEDDNILRVAIADSSVRSLSPINIPVVEGVN